MQGKKVRSKLQLMFDSVKIHKDTVQAVRMHVDKRGGFIYQFIDEAVKEKLARESVRYETK